jgi:hypothetical protein
MLYMLVYNLALQSVEQSLMHADEDSPIEGLSSISGLFRGGDCSVHVLKPSPDNGCSNANSDATTQHLSTDKAAAASGATSTASTTTVTANSTKSSSNSSRSSAQVHAAERAEQQAACSSSYEDSGYSSGESPNRRKRRIRPVAPPFLDWRELFPELSLLLQPQNFADILQEALSVKSAWKVSTTCSSA